jgi:FkbM family methyltransferase
MLGNRPVTQILGAIFVGRNYTALYNMARFYPKFWQNTIRYLTATGRYPSEIQIRTPDGIISPMLYSPHDLLTANEIFCRLDYFADENDRIILDIGSNIGISALYFLTRNKEAKCYLYEPDERNVARLRKNLAGFEARYSLVQKAVAAEAGQFEFGIEETGRYGGIGIKTDRSIIVDCLAINDVLATILAKEPIIDIFKLDTEGIEIKTVSAIQPEHLRRIRKIFIEGIPEPGWLADLFEQKQYGSVCQLTNRHI